MNSSPDVIVKRLPKDLHTINVKILKRVKLRMKIGLWLLKLSARILNANVVIEEIEEKEDEK